VNTTGESQTNEFEDNQATADRAIAAIRVIAAALDGVAQAGPSQSLTPTTHAARLPPRLRLVRFYRPDGRANRPRS
jgi:hypothetical protein